MAENPERTKRRYVSPKRDAMLVATHARIVEAAGELFARDGYRPTTLADIARTAGVSVPRVNLSGSKPALLVEAYTRVATGSTEDRPVTDDPELTALMELPSDDALEAYAAWLEQRHDAAVGLWFALLDAAGTDAQAAEALATARTRHAEACARAVEWARGRDLLAGDVDDEERLRSWELVASAEPYRFLVRENGWSAERYRRWVLRSLRALVLDPRD